MPQSLVDTVSSTLASRLGPFTVDATPVDHHERLVLLISTAAGALVAKADTNASRHRRERLALEAARGAGLPVPVVIDQLAGTVNILVISHLSGEPLHGRDRAESWQVVGGALRALHATPPTGERCIGAGTGGAERAGLFLDYALAGQTGAKDALLPAGAELVRRGLSGSAAEVQIHGDCQPDHFLLDQRRVRVSGILDFGDAGAGDALWDIAVLTFDHPDRAGVVLDGYADTALTDRAARELPAYWALRCLTEIRWLTEHGYDAAAVRDRLRELVT